MWIECPLCAHRSVNVGIVNGGGCIELNKVEFLPLKSSRPSKGDNLQRDRSHDTKLELLQKMV